MSIVLKAKVKRPLKVDGDQLYPGDLFPFDPAERTHKRLWMNNAIALSLAEGGGGLDVDALVEAIRGVDGVGPATAKKIRKVVEDGDWSK